MEVIRVLVEEPSEGNVRNGLASMRSGMARVVEVGAMEMDDSVRKMADHFSKMLEDGFLASTSVVVDEIELSLAVTASGGVELLGKFSAGTQAGLKLKLKRKG
ncbi:MULTISPECIES: Pepco domain-containing protein [Stenotrophomonas]|uniref:Pepco domain-containing protein n=1 Tax=Stenotrophomonas maltophilia TaxID=40324 RepID=A0A3S0HWF3_STEMA|nr:hypothetical protein [Stenotrophomonas maltophilia]RTQ89228.1 hypothetical protein EKL94_10580 [Stenotrophomonas maltophilia]